MKTKLLIAALLFLPAWLAAQDYASNKEKIYIHTNHVFFKPGEYLFFKAYVVNAATQSPGQISRVLYAELIAPSGTVVQKAKFKVEDGRSEGSFYLTENYPGGIYKIRGFTAWMQNEKETLYFTKEITLQKIIAPRVLMKLDFPSKGYGAGDRVKADFAMRNLADEPIRHYEGTYTVSLGGAVQETAVFTTDNEGKASISFQLPASLSTNDGLLNITIRYNGNTEAISHSIPIVLHKIDLQFMPEGGLLINNITHPVAFKAVNEFGKAADVKGEIHDVLGNKIAFFESYHMGMGKFMFTPQPGQVYKAVITSPAGIKEQYPLPPALNRGVLMQCGQHKDSIQISLTSTEATTIQLTGSFRNTILYADTLSLKTGTTSLSIAKKNFPAGIVQFTLSSAGGAPLSERLLFVNENKQLQITIKTKQKKYLPREHVQLEIETKDEEGNPLPSDFSLAVVDDKLWTLADDKQDHILSWLLLSSELKGKIEEPQFYFKKEEPKAVPALDLLMLTQGYRYFDYTEYLVNENKVQFLPDQDHILSGSLVNNKNEPVAGKVLLVKGETGGKAAVTSTSVNGKFFFSELEPGSKYYLLAQGYDQKQPVHIHIEQNGLGSNQAQLNTSIPVYASAAINDKFPVALAKPEEKERKETNLTEKKPAKSLPPQPGNEKRELSEVVVVGYNSAKRKDMTGSVTIVSARDFNAGADLGNALQGKVSGLAITQTGNAGAGGFINLRGAASLNANVQPLILLNGIPVEQFNLNDVNVNEISSVTVLKDASATALYGSSASNGVIVIETKKFNYEQWRVPLNKNRFYASQQVITSGSSFTPVKRFYAPKYQGTVTEERNDFRETIYWNPVIQTGYDGKATVEFSNSDASTTFRVIAEGLGYNGKAGRNEYTYAAQNALEADIKIPPYLTTGDEAMLPLVIKNNSEVTQKMKIEINVPEGFVTGSFNNQVGLQPDSSVRLLVPLTAVKPVDNAILQVTVSSQLGKEKMMLPLSAAAKGFPVIETISGNTAAVHSIAVTNMIPGSMQTKLKLFTDPAGQLTDGIESMLREPYGCFEQTSSTTYPNVFILKYLRESGKVNKEIEAKAMGMIERGYKRLVGFETPKHGFEWFGNPPPHEALTAYGLLEFTDMAEFIDVDKKMLERTKKFLLSRRDGEGGFKLETKGYDAFASVPNKIAASYIVYALTQAGVGKEIHKEYERAVIKALESKDGYQLSMMAIAASNMKDLPRYKKLMAAMESLLTVAGLGATTSVVNSGGSSLRVEVKSLYALALLRDPDAPLARVAGLISEIMKEKSYYGYGSTQATVLALNAITEYAKRTGIVNKNSPVLFSLNDTQIDEERKVTGLLKEGDNRFSVQYSDPDKAIPYSFEISYATYTPPNNPKAELKLITSMNEIKVKTGETTRMRIEVTNTVNKGQPMAVAKIGIPAGLSLQPWQLKEIMEKNQAAYYEIFDNYLVFYWMGFAPHEKKVINLDLKADLPGHYKAKASNAYLYYSPEFKHWQEGISLTIAD